MRCTKDKGKSRSFRCAQDDTIFVCAAPRMDTISYMRSAQNDTVLLHYANPALLK